MPIVINGDGSVGALSATELGYLDGVTSAVQTQINGKLTIPGVWTSYTPSLGGTGWAVGNGSTSGKYTQIGKLIRFIGSFAFGSTSTAGASPLTLTLPVTASSGMRGLSQYFDSSAGALYAGQFRENSATTAIPEIIGTNGLVAYVTTTAPFTWATNDSLTIFGTYEAA